MSESVKSQAAAAAAAGGGGAGSGLISIDWDALRAAAHAATTHAYAPYSGLAVGCAALVTDGRVISGCNVENASYGVTLCAECTMIGELHMGGGGQLVAFVCVDGSGTSLTPCGRCRQVLYEAAAPGMLLETGAGFRTIDELLPEAFGPASLPTPLDDV
ncbi:cytidine deaminase [Leucobacter luti]|nr:cytidine deaminase [Leucobacter luti]TCK39742.1 cytidine deaminase [Leucobacter luti]